MEKWLYARNIMFSKQLLLHKECIGGLKTMSEAMLKLVCWLHVRAKTMRKSINMPTWMISFWRVSFWVLEILRKYNNSFNVVDTLLTHLLWHPNHKENKHEKTKNKNKTRENQKTQKKTTTIFPDSCLGSPLSTEESRKIVYSMVFGFLVCLFVLGVSLESFLFFWFSKVFSDLGLISHCRDSFRVCRISDMKRT